jgi:hypothetical protein
VVPIFDNGTKSRSKAATFFGVVVLIALIGFTVWGALS